MAKRILFVRSGGGMPGIDVHVGMWCALEQFGVISSACSGTSAGAIVSALDACGFSAARAASIVLALRDKDVRREVPFWKIRIPWIDHFLKHDPIREILTSLLDGCSPDKALQVWACDQMTGEAVNLRSNPSVPLVDAVLASMSISGVFPPVTVGEDRFVDGGVGANLPVPPTAEFDEVWLLIAASSPKDYRERNSIITSLMRNIDFLMINQLRQSILDAQKEGKKVRILWPAIHRRGSALRFDHNLIGEAYAWTKLRLEELKAGGFL